MDDADKKIREHITGCFSNEPSVEIPRLGGHEKRVQELELQAHQHETFIHNIDMRIGMALESQRLNGVSILGLRKNRKEYIEMVKFLAEELQGTNTEILNLLTVVEGLNAKVTELEKKNKDHADLFNRVAADIGSMQAKIEVNKILTEGMN